MNNWQPHNDNQEDEIARVVWVEDLSDIDKKNDRNDESRTDSLKKNLLVSTPSVFAAMRIGLHPVYFRLEK